MSIREFEMFRTLQAAVRQELITESRTHLHPKMKWTVVCDDSSPWILITVDAAEPIDAAVRLPQEFAMWRETRDVYKVVNHAVLDDPVMLEALREHGPLLRDT